MRHADMEQWFFCYRCGWKKPRVVEMLKRRKINDKWRNVCVNCADDIDAEQQVPAAPHAGGTSDAQDAQKG